MGCLCGCGDSVGCSVSRHRGTDRRRAGHPTAGGRDIGHACPGVAQLPVARTDTGGRTGHAVRPGRGRLGLPGTPTTSATRRYAPTRHGRRRAQRLRALSRQRGRCHRGWTARRRARRRCRMPRPRLGHRGVRAGQPGRDTGGSGQFQAAGSGGKSMRARETPGRWGRSAGGFETRLLGDQPGAWVAVSSPWVR